MVTGFALTIHDLLKEGSQRLKDENIASSRLDAELILCNLLDVDRVYLYMYREKEVVAGVREKFWEAIEKRADHMPLQYIVNKQEFMGLDFYLEEGILIPRPDTEILVEKVLEIYRDRYGPKRVKIMDIGTGSGAIAVSLARYIEDSRVTAIDICPRALELARKNAASNQVAGKITFHLGSLFQPIGREEYKSYDFIISNPPYIPSWEIPTLDRGVKDYEPSLALDGGEDGLDFYRHISKDSIDYLKEGGWLMFEIGYNQGKDVREILEINGFKNIRVFKDLAGLDRVVVGHT